MSDTKLAVAQWIQSFVPEMSVDQLAGLIEYPPNPELGDLSLPCFKLSKIMRKSPQQIAETLQTQAVGHPLVKHTIAINGYFNLFLNRAGVAAKLVQEILNAPLRFASSTEGTGKKVVIDYSSPNIAKPFHVGHLRSTMIGNALRNIHEHLGYEVIGINHLGDWGTQFGKLIVAYHTYGTSVPVDEVSIQTLLDWYVKFHDDAKENPALEDEARSWFTKLENGDEAATKLWQWFKQVSMDEFERMYKKLDVTFDSYNGESFYNDQLPGVVASLRDKGLLRHDEGAVLVDLEAFNMPPCLILKKDGSSLYATRDLAAAIYRAQTYAFEKCIYVTGSPQILHFQQWFKVIEMMGFDWHNKLLHVPFGQVSLGGEKFSTRKGNVVLLEDLISQTIAKTKEIMAGRALPNADELAEQVGIGAVVFGDLSHNRMKDIVFSWEDMLNFEGETGPYVQYSYVRTCSILRKAELLEGMSAEWIAMISSEHEAWEEGPAFALIQELVRFPERVQQAADKLEPSIITRHLIDIAQAFNHFYHTSQILVDDEVVRIIRLSIVAAVKNTLALGLRMIGVAAPERM